MDDFEAFTRHTYLSFFVTAKEASLCPGIDLVRSHSTSTLWLALTLQVRFPPTCITRCWWPKNSTFSGQSFIGKRNWDDVFMGFMENITQQILCNIKLLYSSNIKMFFIIYILKPDLNRSWNSKPLLKWTIPAIKSIVITDSIIAIVIIITIIIIITRSHPTHNVSWLPLAPLAHLQHSPSRLSRSN